MVFTAYIGCTVNLVHTRRLIRHGRNSGEGKSLAPSLMKFLTCKQITQQAMNYAIRYNPIPSFVNYSNKKQIWNRHNKWLCSRTVLEVLKGVLPICQTHKKCY
jgi:hypothetical protein